MTGLPEAPRGCVSMSQAAVDFREYPAAYRGRKKYVWTADHGVIAYCYAYTGHDGRYYLLEDPRGLPKRSGLSAPMVMRDISPYRSPIDNTMITSRSAHREHVKVHDVVELGNEHVKPVDIPVVDYGRAIADRLQQVRDMSQSDYDQYVRVQADEHTAIADLVSVGGESNGPE